MSLRPGWLMFAAVTLFAVSFLRLISGISYLADSNKVNDLTGGLFGSDLLWWGLWDLLIAALAFAAAISLASNHAYGRVFGYVWAIVVIVNSFLIISFAPWFAFGMLVLALLVIYALAVNADDTEYA
jgi:hypothetical protein